MSEYQYLEFLAIDHPLTNKDMERLRGISTRAQITPFSFINEYHWGGLKANPRDFMRRYFDAHVFFADWGDVVFMLRLPREAIDQKILKAFCDNPHLEFEALPKHWLLTWSLEETEDYDRFCDVEGSGWMTRLAPLREELIRGDLRGLYIGWLKAIDYEDIDPDDLEPMVLPGLGQLTPAQQSLAEFLEIDIDLLAGLGMDEMAPLLAAPDDRETDAWLDKLPKTEVRRYLRQMLNGQGANAERELNRRYAAWQQQFAPPQGVRRSVEKLWQLAEQAKKKRLAREAKAIQRDKAKLKRQRDAQLAKLASDFPQAWKLAHENADKGHAHAYDAACQQLVDLRDAYHKHAPKAAFHKDLQKFLTKHAKRRALEQRLVDAGLLQAE